MPAIASLEDLKATQKPLRYALFDLRYAFFTDTRYGHGHVFKKAPEKLKGEGK